jgi:DNA-binding transcriptional LysR family regulator
MARIMDQLSRVRFDDLAVFVEVAAAGSIAVAARRLGVPKSTVGRAIARVEQDFGVSLVRRMARGPSLTEPGQLLANLAAPHVAALRDAASALGREATEAYGTLRVTAPPDMGTLIIGPLVAGFLARYPRMRIDVDHTLRIVDLVGEGYDLALRVMRGPMAPSSLVAKKLARLDLGLYAGAAYLARREAPKRAQELAHHDHVSFQRGSARDVLALDGPTGTVQIPITARVSANDFFFVREAIVHGAGIGTLPWYVANAESVAGRLVRVLPEYRLADTIAYLVHAPARPPSPKLQAFRSFLLEHAPRLLAEP